MPSGATVCAATGIAAQTNNRIANIVFFIFGVLSLAAAAVYFLRLHAIAPAPRGPPATAVLDSLSVQLVNFCPRNERRPSKRSRLLILIRATRRRVGNFPTVVNS